MKEQNIKVLIIPTDKEPYETTIENTLEASQKIVGGYIELVCPYEDEAVCLIVNEMGKLEGLPYNFPLINLEDSQIVDMVAGQAFICRSDDEGEFASLTEEDIEHFKANYQYIGG